MRNLLNYVVQEAVAEGGAGGGGVPEANLRGGLVLSWPHEQHGALSRFSTLTVSTPFMSEPER